MEPNTILNTRLDEGTFAYQLMQAHRDYLVDRGKVAPEEAQAWVDDLRALDAAGGTFFSLTQYLYFVRKGE